MPAGMYHSRRSSFEPPTKPRKMTYQSQYSYPTSYVPPSDTSTPRYAQSVFFPKDFTDDFTDAGMTDRQDVDRKFKDACVSPILTIESPRKLTSAHQKQNQWYERRDERSYKMDKIAADTDDRSDDTDDEDAVDGCPTITSSRLNSTENNIFEYEGNNISDSIKSECKIEMDTESLDTKLTLDNTAIEVEPEKTEETYKHPPEPLYTPDNQLIHNRLEEQRDLKKALYKKLSDFIEKNKDIYDAHGFKQPVRNRQSIDSDSDITLEMIDDIVDELTDMPISEQVKMIDKCYHLVNSKDRKLTLNVCIESQNEEIKELKKRLSEEEKKSNEMADDMYKHSQEMKKLDKIRARERHLETENQILREKCAEMEKTREETTQKLNSLQNQNMLLQKYMDQENEYNESRREEKKGASRRVVPGTRKLSLASVNRKPGLYPSTESRMYSQKSSYTARGATRGHISTLRAKRP